jgi:hypothetical protein
VSPVVRRAGIGIAIAGSVAGCVASCSTGTAEPRPVPSLASTTRSALAFERIRDEWVHATDADRQTLRQDIERFIASFPNDGLAPMARVYLVLSLMSPPQDWTRAETLLREMPEPQAGTTHDLYVVAQAKARRHHHDPDGAFDALRPLVGKMVDSTARGLLEEEVSLDALEANRPYEAIAYMDAWIRGATEEGRDAVRAKVSKVLMLLPEQALLGSLRGMRAAGGSHGYGKEIQRLVAQRLADIALDRGDPALARWLLDADGGPAPRIGGDAGVELGELATSKRGLGNVAGRTVGLVLPTESPDLRDEAADVARGMAWALELPRVDPAAGDGVRLVTRDDTGESERLLASLEEIAGEGAAIIVTGLDGASADQAIAWAEPRRITLLLLSQPATAKPGAYAFILGQARQPVIRALVDRVSPAQGKRPAIAPVVEGDGAAAFVQGFSFDSQTPWRVPVACDVQSSKAGDPRFPVASWAAAGVHTWLLASSAECASDLIHEVGAHGGGGVFALTLEAAGVTVRPAQGSHLLAASAGILPLGTSPRGDPREEEAHRMVARLGGRSSWWAALGRDAGALSRKALATMPVDTVTAEADIARRRQDAQRALATARVALWTTEAQGFAVAAEADAGGDGAGHVIARELRIVELH